MKENCCGSQLEENVTCCQDVENTSSTESNQKENIEAKQEDVKKENPYMDFKYIQEQCGCNGNCGC